MTLRRKMSSRIRLDVSSVNSPFLETPRQSVYTQLYAIDTENDIEAENVVPDQTMDMSNMMSSANIKAEPMDPDSTTGNAPKKKPGRPKKMKQEKITEHVTVVKKKRTVDRFKGMSEEEVLTRLLPDHLAPNLDIVIVGINPGLYAAFVGHHYAGPGNHFWKCLYLSGLIPEPMNAMQDTELLNYGIGFTNIVARTSRGSADLSKKEIKQGAEILKEKLLKFKPKIAVFNGKGIYEVFLGHKNFYFGKQPEPLLGTETAVFVMPSSSARCSQLPRAVDKVPFYAALKKFRDHLNGKLPDLTDADITFPDLELKTAKKEPKQEPGEYPGEFDKANMQMHLSGENGLNQFMPDQFQIFQHNGLSSQDEMLQSMSSQPHLPQNVPGMGTMYNTPQGTNFIKQERSLSQSPGSSDGTVNAIQIKQEPGLYGSSGSNCGSPGMVQIKQEPGLTETPTYCSMTNSDNYVHYTQPQDSASSGSSKGGQPDFLSGLYGLVNQVASQEALGSFGIVNARSRPLQFNDALCGIVQDEGNIDLELVNSRSQNRSDESNDSQLPPGGKKAKLKKKKSSSTLSNASSSPNATISLSQEMSRSTPPVTQVNNSIPPSQPLQPFTHNLPNHYQNHVNTSHPYTTYGGNMPYYPHPPVTSYGQGYPMGISDFQHQSFTQLMNDDIGLFPPMGQNYNRVMPPTSEDGMGLNAYHNGHSGHPSNIYNPDIQIKQEKPDS